MTVAEIIKKTRLDDNLTQEEYGAKFGVTRQTVSSWENGKSIPDLQLLITICNTYNISLDALLNEDRNYTRKINYSQKISRIVKVIISVLLPIAIFCLIYVGIWSVVAHREKNAYAARVEKEGFELKDRLYYLEKEDVEYSLGKEELPFLKFHFYAMNIQAKGLDENMEYNYWLSYEDIDGKYYFYVEYALDSEVEGTIDSEGNIKYDKLTKKDKEFLENHKGDIEIVLDRMADYYSSAYGIER